MASDRVCADLMIVIVGSVGVTVDQRRKLVVGEQSFDSRFADVHLVLTRIAQLLAFGDFALLAQSIGDGFAFCEGAREE